MASPESSKEHKRGWPLVDLAIGLGAVALGFTLLEHAVLEGALYMHHHH